MNKNNKYFIVNINKIILFVNINNKMEMENENEIPTYYILITSSEKYQSKLDTMLILLFDQIEHYNYNKQTKQPIQVVVCNDDNP